MKRERFIDVIKGFAILFVIITHYQWPSQVRSDYLFPYWIEMAVPLFMLVSGYVSAKSFSRKGILTISRAYVITDLVEKLIRYVFPFLVIYIVQTVLANVLYQQVFPDLFTFIKRFSGGGGGPGGYYFPLLIQLVFLYPFIYFAIRKYRTNGLLLFFLLDALYELLCWCVSLPNTVYRLLFFRYLFLVAFGSYVALGNVIKHSVNIILAAIGLVLNYFISYRGITLFVPAQWSSTSFLATVFLLPVFYYLSKSKLHCKPVELLGKASYNIYLVQMCYYFFAGSVYDRIPDRWIQFTVSVGTCVILGLLYYKIETPVTKWIISKIRGLKRSVKQEMS